MQNSTTPIQLAPGCVFARESQGNVLVLSPLTNLGSLYEAEIVQEVAVLLELINQPGSAALNLIIDLAQGEYLGTALLGAIVRLWKRISLRGGRMALCHVSTNVVQVLHVTKLQTIWPIYGTRAEALAAIRG
jgi:anti-sigma B factor antagonist